MNYVYFVQAGESDGPIKIGFSADVEGRMGSLRTGNHLPLRLLAKVAHVDAQRIEPALHRAFSDLRLEGEWFRCDDRILNAIEVFVWVVNEGNRRLGEPSPALPARLLRNVEDIGWESAEYCAHPKDNWAVEWSHLQGCFHLQRVGDSLSMAKDVLLLGRGRPTDFVMVAIAPSRAIADQIATALEPWLRAVRAIRNAGIIT